MVKVNAGKIHLLELGPSPRLFVGDSAILFRHKINRLVSKGCRIAYTYQKDMLTYSNYILLLIYFLPSLSHLPTSASGGVPAHSRPMDGGENPAAKKSPESSARPPVARYRHIRHPFFLLECKSVMPSLHLSPPSPLIKAWTDHSYQTLRSLVSRQIVTSTSELSGR